MQKTITHLSTDGTITTRNDDDTITITPSSFVKLVENEALADEPRKLNIGADDYWAEMYDDGSFDEIRASHVLQIFPRDRILEIIQQWVSKLKPGGLLKIAVPDFGKIVEATAAGYPMDAQSYIMGAEGAVHNCTIFDTAKVCDILFAAGLECVRFWPGDDDTSGDPMSLNICGLKPVVEKGSLTFEGVNFILPTPRFGPSDHHRCVYNVLSHFKAKVHSVSGCFWNQHLCEAMETEIKDPDCKYIVTLDYDSIFSVDDVIHMYRVMETHPHIDALVPLQSHRGTDGALFTMEGENGGKAGEIYAEKFDGLTAEISTGHFGLTFIRAEKLRNHARPWMVAQLAPDNTWGEGHIDADIDFWNKWRAAGNQVHLANRVVIGHLQDMIMWPTYDFTPVYQRVTDYLKHGKPTEARV